MAASLPRPWPGRRLRPHYLLRIYVDDDMYPGLRAKYEAACDEHNERVKPWLEGNIDVAFDAGFDLFTPSDGWIKPTNGTCVKIPQGIRCAMVWQTRIGRPVGYYLYLRSSIAAKTPLRLANHTGVIDAGYRGEIIALFDHIGNQPFWIPSSYQRLVQLCPPDLSFPIRVELVKNKCDLGETERGEGGIGSTGQ